MAYQSDALQTLIRKPEGGTEVPQSRFRDATAFQNFARRLIDNDNEKRGYKRARINGLVDGNPPYARSALLKAGRADACNVNWNIARTYLEAGAGAFYDLVTESPGAIAIRTSHGLDAKEREDYSRTISQEADRVLYDDAVWDYNRQVSIWDMVLHGNGPYFFEDNFKVLPRATSSGDVKVPEFTKADTHYWEVCTIQVTYLPHELFEFIEDKKTAESVGWDVEYTRIVIAEAMDIRKQVGITYDWEFYQQELKNNAQFYTDDSKIIKVVHGLWKEFDGTVTHAIVQRDSTSGTELKYLFNHRSRYDTFQQVIHPMYFDRGNGGYHHSVTGLGVKMYGQMEWQNRFLCNLMDKAWAPKTLFKPSTTEAAQRFQLTKFSDYAVLPGGFDVVQNPIQGFLTEGLEMNKQISDIMQSNLSSYRQQVPAQTSGNPPTKFQKQMEAAQQSSLSKTTYNRFYVQMDALYAEVVRRLCLPGNPDERAKSFRKRCKEAGVPDECFKKIEHVEAVRVVGQGSGFMRQQAVASLMPVVGSLNEEGRINWLNDFIAANAGQNAVQRYNKQAATKLATDQQAEALQWVAAMKVGVPPIVTPTQNPATYASTFLSAAVQAVQSVRQGADMGDVVKFLDIAGPAIMAQLKRMENDPTRNSVYQALLAQYQKLAGVADQLKAMWQKQQQQRNGQNGKQRQAMTDEQLKTMKTMNDIQLKRAKTKADIDTKRAKATQDMALSDATTANEIRNSRLRSVNESSDE